MVGVAAGIRKGCKTTSIHSYRYLYRRAEANQKTGMLCSSSHGTCVLCSSAMEIAGRSQQHDHSSTIGHEDGEELCSVPAGSRGCSVAALWNNWIDCNTWAMVTVGTDVGGVDVLCSRYNRCCCQAPGSTLLSNKAALLVA